MELDLNSILGTIKETEETKLKNEKASSGGDPRILKLKKHCSYTLRMLPHLANVNDTFVTFKEVGFTSRADGSYVYGGRAPLDVGVKNDLFKKTQWDHYSKAKEEGDEEEQKASYKLIPKRKQLVNAYLVDVDGDDDEAKEKIGTNIVFVYPAQVTRDGQPVSDIFKRIHNALYGDMAKKIGAKALDLSPKGKSLIVKVTEKGGYNNYSDTMFDDPEDLKLSEDKIKEILSGTFDLNEFVPEVKTEEEIKKLIDEHWHGIDPNLEDALDDDEESQANIDLTVPEDDDIPMNDSKDEASTDSDSIDDFLKTLPEYSEIE